MRRTSIRVEKFVVLAAALAASVARAQAPEQPVVLSIDIEDFTSYRGIVFDASKLAKDPGPLPNIPAPTFAHVLYVADIVAVNGKPAKGLWHATLDAMPFRIAPALGQPIASVDTTGVLFCNWYIFSPEGTYVGTIADRGFAGEHHALAGGAGAFLGALGEHRMDDLPGPPRRDPSTAEDPANRKLHRGSSNRATFYLYPKFRPTVQMTALGPAVTHASDFSLVTAANPARRGEQLTLRATGLGPVKPNLEPPGSVRFSADPLQVVNSPVAVVFNGKELPTINQVGWPGETDVYRVDFQVPSDAIPGSANIQLISAWIPGGVVQVPVR